VGEGEEAVLFAYKAEKVLVVPVPGFQLSIMNAQDEQVFSVQEGDFDSAEYAKRRVPPVQLRQPLRRNETLMIGERQTTEPISDGCPYDLFFPIYGTVGAFLCVYV
jgi:hypothetical protein